MEHAMEEEMDLQELNVYQRSMDIADRVWMLVAVWPYFAKDTIGKQLVRSVDSIGANISEGYGRYHYSDSATTAEGLSKKPRHGFGKHIVVISFPKLSFAR